MTGCDADGCGSEAVKYFRYQRNGPRKFGFRYRALCRDHCDRAASYAHDDEYDSCSASTFEECWFARCRTREPTEELGPALRYRKRR